MERRIRPGGQPDQRRVTSATAAVEDGSNPSTHPLAKVVLKEGIPSVGVLKPIGPALDSLDLRNISAMKGRE